MTNYSRTAEGASILHQPVETKHELSKTRSDIRIPRHTKANTGGGARHNSCPFLIGNHNGGALRGGSTCLCSSLHPSLSPHPWVKACMPLVESHLFTPFSCLICILFDLLLLIWAPSSLKADVCKQCLFSSRRGLEDDGF